LQFRVFPLVALHVYRDLLHDSHCFPLVNVSWLRELLFNFLAACFAPFDLILTEYPLYMKLYLNEEL
jgi:hypothetical protein